jgi:hypothetical protein
MSHLYNFVMLKKGDEILKIKPLISWVIRLGSVALVAVLAGEISANTPQTTNAEGITNSHVTTQQPSQSSADPNTLNGNSSNTNGSTDASGSDLSGNNSSDSSNSNATGDDSSNLNGVNSDSSSSSNINSNNPSDLNGDNSSSYDQSNFGHHHGGYTRTGGS